MLKTFAPFFLLCFCTQVTHAQILNFEKYRKPGDTEKQKSLVGQVSLDFSLNNRSLNQNGEADLYVGTNIASDVAYFLADHAYYLFGDLVYSAVGEQEITSTGFIHARANLLRRRFLSYELFAQSQFDQARGMDQRLLAGGGLRFKLADTEQNKLAIGTGLMLEKEKWESQHKSLLKTTNYISFAHRFNDRIRFSTIGYYQTGYDDMIEALRNRISGEFVLQANIFGSFSYTTSFFIFYEDKPIELVNKLIFSLTNGFLWKF